MKRIFRTAIRPPNQLPREVSKPPTDLVLQERTSRIEVPLADWMSRVALACVTMSIASAIFAATTKVCNPSQAIAAGPIGALGVVCVATTRRSAILAIIAINAMVSLAQHAWPPRAGSRKLLLGEYAARAGDRIEWAQTLGERVDAILVFAFQAVSILRVPKKK